MTAGASSSRSGSGSCHGRRRGMDRESEGADDQDNGSEYCENPVEDEEDSDDEIVYERAARSVSEGHYKKRPKDGEPKLGVVHFLDGAFIEEPNYMKTLNGIIRANWDEKTIHTKGKEREKFWDDVIEEFKKYYEYPQGIKEAAGDRAIKAHMKENLKQMLYQEKKRANKRVFAAHEAGHTEVTRGTSRPYYLTPAAWDSINEYWGGDTFKRYSKANTKNRAALDIHHRSGAKPFCKRRRDLEKKKNRLVSDLEVFDDVYNSNTPAELELREMMERVRANQEEPSLNDPPLSPSSHYKREVVLSAKARKPKKGRAFLHSRHTMNEILGADQARKLIASHIHSHIQNNTSQSTPPENQTYSIMLRAMSEVTVLVNSMDGMAEVPRSYLDEQLQLLATGAYPDRTDPVQAALWDQYVRMAGDMATNLLQTYKKVITEGTRVEKAPIERNPFQDDDVDPDAGNYPLH